MLRYRVLGPLLVDDDPERTPQRPARRRLLAALVLHAGSPVAPATLMECLWGDDPPVTAPNTLQAHVSGLRRRLADDRIETTPSGYRLVADSRDVDATTFADAVARARAARFDGSPATVLAAVEDALALWRGDPYPDLVDAPMAAPEIGRLVELRAGAEELRVGALLDLGRWEDAIADLEALVRAHPARERLWEHLMQARRLAGRPAEALDTYREARVQLREFGLDPGARLRHLEHQVLRESDLATPGPADAPGARAASHLVVPTWPRPPRPRTHPWDLVGRAEPVAAIRRALEGDLPGVVVAGVAGVGKSRLLHEADLLAGATGHVTVAFRANESLRSVPLGVAGRLAMLDPAPVHVQIQHLLRVLGGLRTSAPPVVLVDDANHLDGATLALLTHAIESGVAVIVASIRTDTAVSPVVTRWWADLGVARVSVSPLADAEMSALVAQVLGPTTVSTRDRLVALSAGNPLHLRELVRGARDLGALGLEDGRWSLQGEVVGADRLNELVDATIDRLGDAARAGFEAVAVARPLALAMVEELAGAEAVEALERRRLVEVAVGPDGPVVDVVHPLHAENVAARLTARRRRELVAAIAAALARHGFPLDGDVLRAATLHLELGDLAPELATRACSMALARLDADLAERLAAVATADGGDATAWQLRGRAAFYRGEVGLADGHLARAQALAGDEDTRVDVVSERAANLGFGGRDPGAAIAVLDDVVADVIHPGHAARLRVERALFLGMTGRLRAVVDEADALDDAELPPTGRLSIAVSATLARAMLGRVRGVADDAASSLALADDLRSTFPMAREQLLVNRASALVAEGRVADALALSRSALARARSSGGLLSMWETFLQWMLDVSGEVGEAAERARAIGPVLSGPDPLGMHLMWPPWAGLPLVQAGDAEAARRMLAAADRAAALREPRSAVWWGRVEAWLELPDIDVAAARLVDVGRAAVAADHVVWGVLALYDAVRLGRPGLVVDAIDDAVAATDGAVLLETLADGARADDAGDVPALVEVAERLEAHGARLLAAEALCRAGDLAAGEGGEPLGAPWRARARDLAAGLGAVTPALAAVTRR